MRSQEAVGEMNDGQQTRNAVNRLLQSMLDAETGQRGYLLTGNETYLEPYDKAVTTVHANLDELRTRYLKSPDELQEFANLSREVSRKLAEMERPDQIEAVEKDELRILHKIPDQPVVRGKVPAAGQPADVRPEEAMHVGRMSVFRFIGMLVVVAVMVGPPE